MPTGFARTVARLVAVLVAVALAAGLHLVSWPEQAVAKDGGELSTCLNLATGVTRVLARGSCDPVSEMAHAWSAVAADEPLGRVFSARTLSQAVVLNTGGDTRKFTKRDWAAITALDVANRADSARSGDAGTGTVAPAGAQEVRSVVTTCVNDATGVARIIVSGGCEGRSESRKRWVSVEPLQKPSIADGAPGIPEVTGVRSVGTDGRAVSFEAPEDSGSSPITSMTVIAIPGGQSVTIRGGAGGTALFTGLTPGTKYTFRVVAVNASGAGPRVPSQVLAPGPERRPEPAPAPTPAPVPSPSVSTGAGGGSGGGGAAPIAAPGSPGTPVAVAGDASATVTVAAGTGSGGAPASYLVTAVGTARTCTVTGSSGSCLVTGLSNGTAYTFTATASNTGGTSTASVASTSATPMAVQSITFVNPGTRNFGTTPTLTATSDSALTVTLTSSTSGVCTISGGGVLAFVSAGTCSINANQAGNSSTLAAPQVTVSFTVAAVAPGAPTIGATAMASGTSATVAFTAPTSNGGATITSYTATSTPGSVTATLTQAGSGTITVTGLTTGTAYTFTITATNPTGTSSASSPSGSVTPGYTLGATGPGGGLVFLISGGRTYEMAPNNWGSESGAQWCDVASNVTGSVGTAIGTGFANTTAMDAACSSGAGQLAADYAGGGLTDWFLPSQEELREMYYFSIPAGAVATYAFAGGYYWSSSQWNTNDAVRVQFGGSGGSISAVSKTGYAFPVRPIRSSVT